MRFAPPASAPKLSYDRWGYQHLLTSEPFLAVQRHGRKGSAYWNTEGTHHGRE